MLNRYQQALWRSRRRSSWRRMEEYHRSQGHTKTAAFYHNLLVQDAKR